MCNLVEPDLWKVTLPAIRATLARGHEYLESGKYVSRVKLPKYAENNFGWSTTTKSDLDGGKESPPDWRSIVGITTGHHTGFGYDEVPELVAAAEWVSTRADRDSDFFARMTFLARALDDPDKRRREIHGEFIRFFIADLVGRGAATNAKSDADWRKIYSQLERARFAQELRGDLVVPITLTPFDLDQPLQLGGDVWIEPLDEELQRARATSIMWGGRVPAHVVAAATHAVVVRDISIDNSDLFLRRWQSRTVPEMSTVDLAIQAVHIVTNRDTGYAQAIVRPHDWADDWDGDLPPIWSVGTFHMYPENFDQGGWNNEKQLVAPADFEQIPKVFRSLEKAPSNVKLAARRAMRAVLRDDDEDETLDATIGIEALLMSDGNKQEVTHRIALRAASALGVSGHNPVVVADLIRKVYAHRSAIVHGSARKNVTIKIGKQHVLAHDLASILLRLLLLDYLSSDMPWTPASLDSRILESLAAPSESDDAPAETGQER